MGGKEKERKGREKEREKSSVGVAEKKLTRIERDNVGEL